MDVEPYCISTRSYFTWLLPLYHGIPRYKPVIILLIGGKMGLHYNKPKLRSYRRETDLVADCYEVGSSATGTTGDPIFCDGGNNRVDSRGCTNGDRDDRTYAVCFFMGSTNFDGVCGAGSNARSNCQNTGNSVS